MTAAPFPAHELIVDSFAGGGGASRGIEMALGRSPDIAINHDDAALAMHRANHPATLHVPHNVWKVDPLDVTGGRPVGLLWASPDCKHHSKAKGGKPVQRNIRDLAWVVVRWAKQVRPRVIIVENVEEFRGWGPLDARDLPCRARKGETFQRWVAALRRLGYVVEWRELRACDYGAPTIRRRLFVVARRDGRPIAWPAPTHGDPRGEAVGAGRLAPWRTAAEIIDWSLPCRSIFLSREEGQAVGVNRPLAPNTLARIAKGVRRYVLEAAEPFVVPITHTGDARVHGLDEPLRTVTTAQRGEHAVVTPFVTKFRRGATGHAMDEPLATVTANGFESRPGGATPLGLVAPVLAGCGGRAAQSPPKAGDEPLNTVTAKADQVLVAPHLSAYYGAGAGGIDRTAPLDEPIRTQTTENRHAVVAASLVKHNFGDKPCQAADEPLHTVTTQGNRFGLVAAFLAQHNTDMVGHSPREPVSTIVGKGLAEVAAPLRTADTGDRFGLVTVTIGGVAYVVTDIGMRMLQPRELFRAQGFGDDYVIGHGVDAAGAEAPLTKTAQVRMCGNSVCPPVAAALVAANYVPDQPAVPRRRVTVVAGSRADLFPIGVSGEATA